MGGGLERGVARLGLALGGKLFKVPTAR